jgi:hypothetical protein
MQHELQKLIDSLNLWHSNSTLFPNESFLIRSAFRKSELKGSSHIMLRFLLQSFDGPLHFQE